MEEVQIVGNGWTAYYFAKSLDKSKYIPIIIAPNARVLSTPKLTRLAVNPHANVEFDNPYALIIDDVVTDLDVQTQQIHCNTNEPITYKHIVLAIGAEVNDFNIPGVNQYTLKFKTIADAEKLHSLLVDMKAAKKEENDCIINIIGSGPTGVELASKMRRFLGYDNSHDINILEGLKQILPGFSSKSQEDISHYLTHHNQINLLTNDFVAEITAEHVVTSKARTKYPYNLIIWTGGVRFNGYNTTKLFHTLNTLTTTPRGMMAREDFSIFLDFVPSWFDPLLELTY